jgi:hypothetical protein
MAVGKGISRILDQKIAHRIRSLPSPDLTDTTILYCVSNLFVREHRIQPQHLGSQADARQFWMRRHGKISTVALAQ